MTRLIPFIVLSLLTLAAFAEPSVRSMRTPDGGIQPQAAVDDSGVVHLIYFKGDPGHGNLFYVRSTDDGVTFSPALRVNSQEGSAIATGTIRGAHLALGKGGRPHVAWNGSGTAEPKGPAGDAPMLYARLNDAADAFEPQRNVISRYYGLDGGGSLAADREGNVYVAWHAPLAKGAGEASRRVWVARSTDDGQTFAAETQAFAAMTGACGCCGMKLFADTHGSVFALYRSATEQVHRDMYLLRSDDHGARFTGADISPMTVGQCVMSSAAMTAGPDGVLAAWETQTQIYWSRVSTEGAKIIAAIAAPGNGRARKHPALAVNAKGEVLLAWTEGTGWNKGGSIAWQVYDARATPIPTAAGTAPGLPVWSLPTAFAQRDGGFVVVY